MRKISLSLYLILFFSFFASGQLMVTKMIGKDANKYGTGFGFFAFFDLPMASENQSIRLELAEFAYYPTKGDGFFTADNGKGYISFKLGYKYVFSETATGFYLLPSAGAASVMLAKEDEPEADAAWGFAGAMEGGYQVEVGEKGHVINLGLKYEYDYAKQTHQIQSLGLRVSYSFGMFNRREY